MAVTLEEISGWLDNKNINHKIDEENSTIISGNGGEYNEPLKSNQ